MAKPTQREKIFYREAAIEPGAIRDEGREVDLSFSSEEPVERYDWGTGKPYMEVLDHSRAASGDLTRLNNGGALLRDHNRNIQTGVVKRGTAEIRADKKGACTVKFSRSKAGDEEFQDVKDGIRTLVSFGYEPGSEISREMKDGMEYRRVSWKALEVSIVSIPADVTVGIGRSKKRLCGNCDGSGECPDCDDGTDGDDECKSCDGKTRCRDCGGTGYMTTAKEKPVDSAHLPKTENAPQTKFMATEIEINEARKTEKTSERARVTEITKAGETLAKDHPHCADKIRAIVSESLDGDVAVADFQLRAMKEVLGAKPVQTLTMAELGMDERDQRTYSILRGIQSCLTRGKTAPDGLEGDVHRELEKRAGMTFEGFGVPHNAPVRCRDNRGRMARRSQRDLNVGAFGQGGATVATEVVTPIIEILRNRMICPRLGVQVMGGLQSNVAIPRQTGAATAYCLPESATLTKSTQTLDQILLAPHRVGAWNDYTRQLLLQSSIDVENFIRDDLMKVLAIKWDALILNGQGAGSEPTGIFNTPGIGSVTFGGAATFSKMVAFETALAVQNADVENCAYVTSPSSRGVLKSAAKLLTGQSTVTAAIAIWENENWGDGYPDGIINGYRACATNQILQNLMLFGNFEDAIQGLYGGYDVIVNPYSRDTDAAVRITVNTFGDVAVRHPVSFCASSDAANQ